MEDAITWSVFGTLNYFPRESQVQFVNSLICAIDEEPQISNCSIQLWTRIAHPDTLCSGGPELDVQIVGDKLVIFGECKWTAKVAQNQGKEKRKDQLQLRREYQQKYGNRIFHKAHKVLVLIVSLSEQKDRSYPNITWEEICSKTQHPLRNEIVSYYLWKKKNGK